MWHFDLPRLRVGYCFLPLQKASPVNNKAGTLFLLDIFVIVLIAVIITMIVVDATVGRLINNIGTIVVRSIVVLISTTDERFNVQSSLKDMVIRVI